MEWKSHCSDGMKTGADINPINTFAAGVQYICTMKSRFGCYLAPLCTSITRQASKLEQGSPTWCPQAPCRPRGPRWSLAGLLWK